MFLSWSCQSELCILQCDGHTTRNSFNVELNFCLVGICMELSVQSVHFRISRHFSPRVWPKTSVLAKNLSISRGGSIYIYIYVCFWVGHPLGSPTRLPTGRLGPLGRISGEFRSLRFLRFLRLLYAWAMPKHLRMFDRRAFAHATDLFASTEGIRRNPSEPKRNLWGNEPCSPWVRKLNSVLQGNQPQGFPTLRPSGRWCQQYDELQAKCLSSFGVPNVSLTKSRGFQSLCGFLNRIPEKNGQTTARNW